MPAAPSLPSRPLPNRPPTAVLCLAVLLVVLAASPAGFAQVATVGQVSGLARSAAVAAGMRGMDRLASRNRKLVGRIVDFTHNHGADRRFFSPVLGELRDAYVYLPPGYRTDMAYPQLMWMHGAFGDESSFLSGDGIPDLDQGIAEGRVPPLVVVAPDLTYAGEGGLGAIHSLGVNGLGGPFADYLRHDVPSFLASVASVRTDRDARGIAGLSGGGYAALSFALKYSTDVGAVATLSAPANLRYISRRKRLLPFLPEESYRRNFSPETFAFRDMFDPDEIGASFFLFLRLRTGRFIDPVYGEDSRLVIDRIRQDNPADLLWFQGKPDPPLDIYLRYGARDNFNFDAQNESFIALAEQRGVPLTVVRDKCARHLTPYFNRRIDDLMIWIAHHLDPPLPIFDSFPPVEHLPPVERLPPVEPVP